MTRDFDPVALVAKFKASGKITVQTADTYEDIQRAKVRECMRRKRRREKQAENKS